MKTLWSTGSRSAYEPATPVLRDISVASRPGADAGRHRRVRRGQDDAAVGDGGLLRPAAGPVTVDGAPLRDRDHAVAERVVLIPQDNGLAAILTAQREHPGRDDRRRRDAGRGPPDHRRVPDGCGLAGQADQLVEELSGGQQQRTAIARGLALRGDMLLADEVTSELDAANRQSVLRLCGPRPTGARPSCSRPTTRRPRRSATGNCTWSTGMR